MLSLAIKKNLFYLTILIAGIGLGFLLDKESEKIVPTPVREENSEYKFINPLLFVDYRGDQESNEYALLHELFLNYINKASSHGKILDASVYFRKINSGKSISVNPEKTYSPSSMLKVVNMITVLRAAESDPLLLSKPINIKGDDAFYLQENDRYAPKNQVRSGETHTVQELIEHSIIESDNVANKALKTMIGEERLSKTYADLRMPKVDFAQDRGYTTEDYSHLFRVLYNGTYLSRSLSEQVLDLLSKTSFDKGIVAGVPENTTVSHKFGINSFSGGETAISYVELHDCGIVYYPDHPYFICIMTRGHDFGTLESVIKDISKIGWDYLDSKFNVRNN